MSPDPRDELADIVRQTADYLVWLKEDGVGRLEVEIGASQKAIPAVRAASPVVQRSGISAATPKVGLSVEQGQTGQPAPTPGKNPVATGDDVKAELEKITAEVSRCKACPLHEKRTNTVPGQGNPHPEIMFIGEAPGEDEDLQGLAFVGRAGQLLTRMIEAMGYKREEVFIANIAKCRPPNNRKPTPEEMATCIPFLKRQIALIRPKVIVALGATAVEGLLGLTGISKLRGRWHVYEDIDLMPTYHPSYLLRNPPAKREVWEDLQMVLKKLGRTPPPIKKAE